MAQAQIEWRKVCKEGERWESPTDADLDRRIAAQKATDYTQRASEKNSAGFLLQETIAVSAREGVVLVVENSLPKTLFSPKPVLRILT